MARINLVATMLVYCLLPGCMRPQLGGRLSSNVTGIMTELAVPGTYAFSPMQMELDPYETFTTGVITAATVRQNTPEGTFNYNALLGPELGNPNARIDGWIHTSKPRFDFAGTGWLLIWRLWPYGATPWVSAQAEGSTVLIQIVSSSHQRVFFLGGSMAKVTCLKNPDNIQELRNSRTYVNITLEGGDCKFEGPRPLDPGPGYDVTKDAVPAGFVSQVTNIAQQADPAWDPAAP